MKIAHHVYFTLADSTPAKIEAMLSDMRGLLNNHPGLEYFSCGVLNQELDRPVNDRGFHVSLHTVFESRAAHDAYQSHPRHLEFIQRNKHLWELVRVFDSNVD